MEYSSYCWRHYIGVNRVLNNKNTLVPVDKKYDRIPRFGQRPARFAFSREIADWRTFDDKTELFRAISKNFPGSSHSWRSLISDAAFPTKGKFETNFRSTLSHKLSLGAVSTFNRTEPINVERIRPNYLFSRIFFMKKKCLFNLYLIFIGFIGKKMYYIIYIIFYFKNINPNWIIFVHRAI